MANSIITFPSIGSPQASFSFSFDYLEPTDIDVFVEGVSVFANNTSTGTSVGGNTYTVAFSSAGSKTLTFSPAVPQGSTVRIERNTDLTSKVVDFSDGAVLTEIALDSAVDQVFFAAQEAIDKTLSTIAEDTDGKWDAQNKVIKNVATPASNNDAANKAYVDVVVGSASAAATSATQSATSATNSANSATASSNSATASANSATASANSASAASTSETNAATSASTAATQATNSSNSATASANSATASATSATASANSATAAASSATDAQGSEDEAEEWATKTNGIVASTGYSSKAWATGGTGVTSSSGAGAAQEWATKASNSTVDGTELSSKAYAVGDMNRGSAGAHSAKDWASYVSGLNTVDGTHKSARAYAIDAANAVADFNQVYYGTYANDTDAETAHTNAGNTVAAGDLYFSTSTNAVRYYNGSTWTDIAAVNTSNFATAGFSIAMSIAL